VTTEFDSLGSEKTNYRRGGKAVRVTNLNLGTRTNE